MMKSSQVIGENRGAPVTLESLSQLLTAQLEFNNQMKTSIASFETKMDLRFQQISQRLEKQSLARFESREEKSELGFRKLCALLEKTSRSNDAMPNVANPSLFHQPSQVHVSHSEPCRSPRSAESGIVMVANRGDCCEESEVVHEIDVVKKITSTNVEKVSAYQKAEVVLRTDSPPAMVSEARLDGEMESNDSVEMTDASRKLAFKIGGNKGRPIVRRLESSNENITCDRRLPSKTKQMKYVKTWTFKFKARRLHQGSSRFMRKSMWHRCRRFRDWTDFKEHLLDSFGYTCCTSVGVNLKAESVSSKDVTHEAEVVHGINSPTMEESEDTIGEAESSLMQKNSNTLQVNVIAPSAARSQNWTESSKPAIVVDMYEHSSDTVPSLIQHSSLITLIPSTVGQSWPSVFIHVTENDTQSQLGARILQHVCAKHRFAHRSGGVTSKQKQRTWPKKWQFKFKQQAQPSKSKVWGKKLVKLLENKLVNSVFHVSKIASVKNELFKTRSVHRLVVVSLLTSKQQQSHRKRMCYKSWPLEYKPVKVDVKRQHNQLLYFAYLIAYRGECLRQNMEGKFQVKHKWRFKQFKQASAFAFGVEQVDGKRTKSQPFGSFPAICPVFFISSSFRSHLLSRAGVYRERVTVLLMVNESIELFSMSCAHDFLKHNINNPREQTDALPRWLLQALDHQLVKEKGCLVIHIKCHELQVLIQQNQKWKQRYKNRMFKYKNKTRKVGDGIVTQQLVVPMLWLSSLNRFWRHLMTRDFGAIASMDRSSTECGYLVTGGCRQEEFLQYELEGKLGLDTGGIDMTLRVYQRKKKTTIEEGTSNKRNDVA